MTALSMGFLTSVRAKSHDTQATPFTTIKWFSHPLSFRTYLQFYYGHLSSEHLRKMLGWPINGQLVKGKGWLMKGCGKETVLRKSEGHPYRFRLSSLPLFGCKLPLWGISNKADLHTLWLIQHCRTPPSSANIVQLKTNHKVKNLRIKLN